MTDPGALIIHGRGADLGNFRFFVEDLKSMSVAKKYSNDAIVSAPTRDAFFAAVHAYGSRRPLAELHIFTHAWGGGLAFGYDSPLTNSKRVIEYSNLKTPRRRATYLEVLEAEIGIVFTDDLLRSPYANQRAVLRRYLTPSATIKLWGCNSGMTNWLYHDENIADQSYHFDPSNPAINYWWRALNTQRTPKPAIAKAVAGYFGRPVYGATSGASIQVLHHEKWIVPAAYRKATGRLPGEPQLLRLQPDRGEYKKFLP